MHARAVTVLAAGGTIASTGERAVPFLDASALLDAVPRLAELHDLRAETVLSVPGPQLTLEQALALARRACEEAAGERGIVLTTGTDTLEELAVLCALHQEGPAPIVLTGANRPASAPGADGPANLQDAVAVAGAPQADGLGTVVVFGGEVHPAMTVAKLDSIGPAAFGSPFGGPVGRVVEGRVRLHARPSRPPTIEPRSLEHRVDIVTASLGDEGALLRAAAADADGLVVVALGAGHLPPGMLGALREAAARIPVLLTGRVQRPGMLYATYGFEGSEHDVRASGAIPTPFLSAPAARMALLCCLGAGFDTRGIATALASYDA